MSQIELKHLKMIQCIARTGNMTKAAKMLFISQSALSQQLKEIETRLNTAVFIRTGKKMVLTRIGTKLLNTANTVIESIADAELEIEKTIRGQGGELKVGTHCIFCYKWLPKVLAQFHEKYPHVLFDLGTARNIVGELEEKSYDIIITGMDLDENTFTCYPLFSDRLVCIMSPNHPLFDRPYVDFKDFAGHCLISNTPKKENRFVQAALVPLNVEPAKCMVVEQHQAAIEMAAAGFGIGVAPRWAVKDALESGQVAALPITPKGIDLTWKAAVLKNTVLSVFQKEFIRLVGRLPIFDHQSNAKIAVSG